MHFCLVFTLLLLNKGLEALSNSSHEAQDGNRTTVFHPQGFKYYVNKKQSQPEKNSQREQWHILLLEELDRRNQIK